MRIGSGEGEEQQQELRDGRKSSVRDVRWAEGADLEPVRRPDGQPQESFFVRRGQQPKKGERKTVYHVPGAKL